MDAPLFLTIGVSLLSAAGFGFSAHFQRQGLDGTSPGAAARINLTTLFVLSWMTAPFYLDWSMFLTPGALIFAGIGVLFPFLTMQLQIASVPRVGAVLTTALGNFSTFFAVFPAIFILGETLGLQGWIGVGVMSGALIASAMRWGGPARTFALWALLIPLAAAALRGFGMPAIKIGQETAPDPMFGLLVMSCVSTVLIHLMGLVRREPLLPASKGAWWLVAAGAAQWAGLAFMALALSIGDVVLVTPIVSTAPLWGLAYGAWIFKREVLGLRHAITAALVVAGGVLLVTR